MAAPAACHARQSSLGCPTSPPPGSPKASPARRSVSWRWPARPSRAPAESLTGAASGAFGRQTIATRWVRRAASPLPTRLLRRSSGVMEQTGNIPPRYALRLDDLRPWHVIIATCAVCRRRAHVAAALLQHHRPPYNRLRDLQRKLRCTGCGNRHGNTVTVSMAPRN
jgi:hypothetical protein